jgi:hypothetical protein
LRCKGKEIQNSKFKIQPDSREIFLNDIEIEGRIEIKWGLGGLIGCYK